MKDLAVPNMKEYALRGALEVRAGDHVCSLHPDRNEMMDVLAEYVRDGEKENHKIVCIHGFTPTARDDVINSLAQRNIPVANLIDKGQLALCSAPFCGVPHENFDWEMAMGNMSKMEAEAKERGYSALRIATDMVWVVQCGMCGGDPACVDSKKLCHWESQLDSFYNPSGQDPFSIGLCQYNMQSFDSGSLNKVMEVHPQCHVGGELHDNIYFVPPEEFLSGDDTYVLRKRLDTLVQCRRVEGELRAGREEALRLKEAAERAERAKTTFLAQMSHEIRTAMCGIITTGEMLAATDLSTDQKELVDTVQVSSRYLLHILNEVLLFSKMEQDKVDLECCPTNPRAVLKQVQQMFLQTAEEKGLELVFSVDRAVPATVLTDATRLTQILSNLVSNSLKFTQSGGNIRVYCKPLPGPPTKGPDTMDGGGSGRNIESIDLATLGGGGSTNQMLLFTVADTGIGIPKEKHTSIFDSFTQVEAATSRKYGGTGLGLTICARLARLMGGSVWVDPTRTAPGVGTTLHVTIRAPACAGQTGARGEKKTGAPHRRHWRHIAVGTAAGVKGNTVPGPPLVEGCKPPLAPAGAMALHPSKLPNIPEMSPISLPDPPIPSVPTEIRANPTTPMETSSGYSGSCSSPEPSPTNREFSETRKPHARTARPRSHHNKKSASELQPGPFPCPHEGVRSRSLSSLERTADVFTGEDSGNSETLSSNPRTSGGSSGDVWRPHPELHLLRVLIAEDNPINQKVFSKLLGGLGFNEVNVAENGAVAVKMCEEKEHDVIFMDIQMPEMDGYEAGRLLRAREKQPGQKTQRIIALTASYAIPEAGNELGAVFDHWLTKPVTVPDVICALECVGLVECTGQGDVH